MPYIGKSPVGGGFHKLDNLTASATATYALTLGGAAYYPETANQLLVSLNGVIQAPQDSFTVSGSNLVFDSALTASDSIDFVVALGDVLGVQGVTDGAVSTNKIANGAVTDAKIDTMAASKLTGALPASVTSSGVYLGGTGSANYLNDYEFGTWTPVIQDSSGNSSSTAASQSYYTKIAKQVTVTATLANFDTTGLLAGDDLRIYGFPFQSAGTSVGSAVVNYLSTTSTDQTNSVYSYMPNNNTYVTIYETRRSASGLNSDVSAFNSGFSDIYLTHTYFTD